MHLFHLSNSCCCCTAQTELPQDVFTSFLSFVFLRKACLCIPSCSASYCVSHSGFRHMNIFFIYSLLILSMRWVSESISLLSSSTCIMSVTVTEVYLLTTSSVECRASNILCHAWVCDQDKQRVEHLRNEVTFWCLVLGFMKKQCKYFASYVKKGITHFLSQCTFPDRKVFDVFLKYGEILCLSSVWFLLYYLFLSFTHKFIQ